MPQADLLSLDSPFLSEPPAPMISSITIEPDFEKIWTALENTNSRGWCEVTIDVVVRKLQRMQHTMQVIASDQPPFHGTSSLSLPLTIFYNLLLGELKITLTPSLENSEHSGIALLRLKDSEDDSCLWQMRCADDQLRAHIRQLLTDSDTS